MPFVTFVVHAVFKRIREKIDRGRFGFNLSFFKQGEWIKQSLPGLMYTHEIVFMTDNKEDLQRLMDIYGKYGDSLRLKFNVEKLAVMILNDNQGNEHWIQEVTLKVMDKYRYLGVWINNGTEYLTEHENM